MFLSNIDIRKALEVGDITLSDFSESRLQPASYDVLLGNTFTVTETHAAGFADPAKKIFPKTRMVTVPDGEPFILHPGASVLGTVHDYIGAKRDYLIQLSGKSSLARIGLVVHNTAGIINPGHYLNITLELSNTSNVPIILRPKMEIAQLLFSKMTSPSSHDWKQTQTYIDETTQPPAPTPEHKPTPAPVPQQSQHDDHPEQQYLDILRETLEGDEQVDKGTGVKTYSLFGRQIRFDLSKGFPLLTTKKVYWKGVLHELYWFMSGQSNIKYLVDNNVHIWDDYPYKIYKEKVEREEQHDMSQDDFIKRIGEDAEFAREHGELPHIYGEHWRRWQARDGREVDQLGWVIDELRKDPDAHNTLVTSWNPEYMYAMAPPGKGARFPICHNMYQVNIKEGKVCLQLYQRSADIFLGVPFNIASYALLTVIIAKILGREPGEFVHTFGDVHIYENHIEQAKKQLEREPKAFPTIKIDGVWASLDDVKTGDIILENYDSHKTIKADLTVAGGYNKDLHDSTTEVEPPAQLPMFDHTDDSTISVPGFGEIKTKQTTTDNTSTSAPPAGPVFPDEPENKDDQPLEKPSDTPIL